MMQHTTPYISIPKKILAVALAAVLAVSLCPLPKSGKAYADPIAEKQAEAATVLANLNAMQASLDQLSTEYGNAIFAQEEAEQNRDAAEERITEINGQIDELQERLSERAREMYRGGSTTFLDIILGAQSFEEFATGWDIMNKVNENDAEMVQERKSLKEEAQEQANIYEEQAQIAREKADEAAAATAEAEATVAEMQATYDGLSAEVAELVEQERQAQIAAEAAKAQEIVNNSANNAGFYGGNDGGGSVNNGGDGGANNNSSYAPSNPPSYNASTGNAVVDRAYACLGAPYVWGAVGPGGYDCSGLVSYALSGSHIRLGTTGTFINWPRVSDPQPGDVCVVHNNYSQHTGIYIGNGQMIHAATFGVGVIVGPVQSGMIIVRQP